MFPDFPDLQGTEKRSIVVPKSVNLVTVTKIPHSKLQKKGRSQVNILRGWARKQEATLPIKHFFIPFRVPARLKGRSYTENRAASREQVAS